MIKSYRELKVWQEAERIFAMVCEDVRKFPNHKIAWAISDQVIRSSGSIGANIAEGFARYRKKELIHFFIIARSSSAESEVWLMRAEQQKFITSERLELYLEKFLGIQKMLNSFISKLNKSLK